MPIRYEINTKITTAQFIQLLEKSTLGTRRPIDDTECLQGMLDHSNLSASAWSSTKLIGLARSITDFHYACYLSDLAVDKKYQGAGIGKKLQQLTQTQLGPRCKLILIASPAANAYYEHLGFSNNERCWVLERHDTISD